MEHGSREYRSHCSCASQSNGGSGNGQNGCFQSVLVAEATHLQLDAGGEELTQRLARRGQAASRGNGDAKRTSYQVSGPESVRAKGAWSLGQAVSFGIARI